MGIGKGGAVHSDILLVSFYPVDGCRDAGVVSDIAGVKEFIDDRQIPLIQDLLKHTMRGCLVVFG